MTGPELTGDDERDIEKVHDAFAARMPANEHTEPAEGNQRVSSYYLTKLSRQGNRFYTKDGKRLVWDTDSPVGKLAVQKGEFFMHWTNPPDGEDRMFMTNASTIVKWLREIWPDED